MDTLNAIVALLSLLGRAEIRRREVWYSTSYDRPLWRVAQLNLSDALILAPVYHEADMVLPARTVGRNEALDRVAMEIVERALRLATAA